MGFTFIQRVKIANYKSIAYCDVKLGPLMFLVGPNGAGKSNFLDALRLVVDGLRTTLDHALRDRSGIKEVRRRTSGHPTHPSIRLEFSLPDGAHGHYAFKMGARPHGGFEVWGEECFIKNDLFSPPAYFKVQNGQVETSAAIAPAVAPDRLYLVTMSGLKEFAPLYHALSSMGFYNLNPTAIRDPQTPDAGDLLLRDGSNIASVLGQLAARDPEKKQRIEEYLGKIVPGLESVDNRNIGPKEMLEFRQRMVTSSNSWHFLSTNMSDGTLRALGILAALFQNDRANIGGRLVPRVPLVGIEEPEVALHPAASGVLLDALRVASQETQILVTSHSPELLDSREIAYQSILAVLAQDGMTHITRLDSAVKQVLKDQLFTPGELLRQGQLTPEPTEMEVPKASQIELFGPSEPELEAEEDAA